MRRALSLLWCVLLAACATPPAAALRDDEVFAVSDAMRQFIATEIAGQAHRNDAQAALIEALYTKGPLKPEYDASVTRNAAEAFDARAGNCLSLVIMTAAFAKALWLPVRYQSADLEAVWMRSENLLLRSGHINVTLGHRFVDLRTSPMLAPATIDFLPPEELRGLPAREIPAETVGVRRCCRSRAARPAASGSRARSFPCIRDRCRCCRRATRSVRSPCCRARAAALPALRRPTAPPAR